MATGALAALVLLEVLWEGLLAPLPGLRWFVLKAVPLAVLFPGVARGDRKARQWLALIVPFYFAEALVRALSESGRHAFVAGTAGALAAVTFIALLMWFRMDSARA
jgi:uncharacterized membrane protein